MEALYICKKTLISNNMLGTLILLTCSHAGIRYESKRLRYYLPPGPTKHIFTGQLV